MGSRLGRILPNAVRRSYALKFGLVLLVLGASVGAIGFVATNQVQGAVADLESGVEEIEDEVRSNVDQDYAAMAEREARTHESWTDQNDLFVDTLSDNERIRGDESEIQTELNRRLTTAPAHTRSIHYVNTADERIAASTYIEAQDVPMDALDAPWIDRLEQDGTIAGIETTEVYEDDAGNVVVASMAQVRGHDDRVIVYTADVTDYASNFGETRGDGTTMIVDEAGVVQFDRTNRMLLEEYDSALVDEFPGTEEPQTERRDDPPAAVTETSGIDAGEEYLVSYAPIEGTDWYVVVHEPADEAYGFVDTVSGYVATVSGMVDDVARYGAVATVGGVLVIGVFGTLFGLRTARSIDRLTRKTARMENGDLEVDFSTDRVDNIGRLYDGFDNMQDALRDRIAETQQARAEAERARAETERTNARLERTADAYRQVMRECADGNLTTRMDPESENEAMAEIAHEFNAMIDEIEGTIADLAAFALEVASASEEVTASSEEVRTAMAEVSGSVQEISDGAQRQHDRFQAVTDEMGELSTTTEQIAASSNRVADLAERTVRTGEAGREAAEAAIEGMHAIEAESAEAVDEIEALEAEMAQIDELIEEIGEIAAETNMLALNANIESARSGADREGFSVVAAEVKELAAQTKQTAEDVETRIERIQEQTDNAVDVVQNTRDQVSTHTESVENAVESLEEIAEYAAETNEGVQEISAASQQQAASTQGVVAMVDEAATIAEETTAESESVAAAAEEQTAALTSVSQSASDLATQAGRLSQALNRFETDADSSLERAADGLAEADADHLAVPADGSSVADAGSEPAAGDVEPTAGATRESAAPTGGSEPDREPTDGAGPDSDDRADHDGDGQEFVFGGGEDDA